MSHKAYLLESIGPIHTLWVLSQFQPASARSSEMDRRGQPAAMRSAVSDQLRIPLKASTASTLHAPIAQAALSVSSGAIPRSSPIRKPAIVASPDPVVPTT